MYETTKLQNGAQIIYAPLDGTKAMNILVMFPVGSRYETEKMSGVSHYVEHLMFKGTKKRPTTQKLTREIDRLGAGYNAYTGKEYTGYYITVDAKYSETAIDIVSDMLFNSLFDAKEMEREKTVIVEELRMYRDNPLMNIDNVFEELLYDGCPLGRDIGGTEKHVMNYVRDDVLAYRDKYYHPRNMVVVVSGAIDEQTKKYIHEYIGSASTKGSVSKTFKPYCFGQSKKSDRIRVEKKETDQVQLMLGFPGFHYRDTRLPAEAVMNTIFGGSMSSRLFIQVRERRGLAYMIRSGGEAFRDTGYSYVRAGLEAKNINKAIDVIHKEMEKIVQKGVSKKELIDAKTHIRGAFTLGMEDAASQSRWYAQQHLFMDTIHTPEEYVDMIDAVSHDDVMHVAKQLFNWNNIRVAVIGNVDSKKIVY